jgi:hypothetical protein
MELNLPKIVKQFLSAFLLLVLPLVAILLGVILNVLNAWYYILCITWFGMGIVFYGATN